MAWMLGRCKQNSVVPGSKALLCKSLGELNALRLKKRVLLFKTPYVYQFQIFMDCKADHAFQTQIAQCNRYFQFSPENGFLQRCFSAVCQISRHLVLQTESPCLDSRRRQKHAVDLDTVFARLGELNAVKNLPCRQFNEWCFCD